MGGPNAGNPNPNPNPNPISKMVYSFPPHIDYCRETSLLFFPGDLLTYQIEAEVGFAYNHVFS